MSSPTPLYDPELLALLDGAEFETHRYTLLAEHIEQRRKEPVPDIAVVCAARGLVHNEIVIPGYDGHQMVVSIIRRADHSGAGPGILHSHGGGMMIGTRFSGIEQIADWVVRFDAVALSPEYRLAPEFPDPAPVEDCYAALSYFAAHAEELGVDPERILVAGQSAGGGLTAGIALLARDRGGPALVGQLLMCPMLDARNSNPSTHQFVGIGLWDRGSNDLGWNSLLGERRAQASPYASPTLASDLSGLPPTFIDVGSMEIHRDEDIEYANRIWATGGDAELHVWPGGFHGFYVMFPDAVLSKRCQQSRVEWLERILA